MTKTLAGYFHYSKIDIVNKAAVDLAIRSFNPDCIVHFAAESHVDRSIDSPEEFISSNVVGTFNLLQSALDYYNSLKEEKRVNFKFHYISTDEVYGSIADGFFVEGDAYNPASPYAATKAAADHIVNAWHMTYGLPVIVTHCSNNYGPYQHTEKLIPHMVFRALAGNSLPIYGDGSNVRDWLYVDDHVNALKLVLHAGVIGTNYNIAGQQEKTNTQVVTKICNILDGLVPKSTSYAEQIEYVQDRPGHDFRYAIDDSKIRTELGWCPVENFESGLLKTVEWYVSWYKKNSNVKCLASLERQGVL